MFIVASWDVCFANYFLPHLKIRNFSTNSIHIPVVKLAYGGVVWRYGQKCLWRISSFYTFCLVRRVYFMRQLGWHATISQTRMTFVLKIQKHPRLDSSGLGVGFSAILHCGELVTSYCLLIKAVCCTSILKARVGKMAHITCSSNLDKGGLYQIINMHKNKNSVRTKQYPRYTNALNMIAKLNGCPPCQVNKIYFLAKTTGIQTHPG